METILLALFIGMVTIPIAVFRVLVTLLITTHEPPSICLT